MKGFAHLVFVAFSVLTSTFVASTDGAKILGIFVFPGPSQYIYASGLLKELAARGHEVTSISGFPQKHPLKNFHDITITANKNVYTDEMSDQDGMRSLTVIETLNFMYRVSHRVTKNVLESDEFQKLLTSKTAKFDLIITEAILPHLMTSHMGKMTYSDRLYNLCINAIDYYQYNFYHFPRQIALYKQYFPHAKHSLEEVTKNFSLVLVNNHFTLNQPRPYVPNMIEVAGLHIKQHTEPLSADLQEFLDNATEGAIYFSLGSNLRSADLLPEKRQILLETFASLKQKVLWKFEDDAGLTDKPKNLYVSKWFPQPSILAHPNVKVFISHGGWLSTTEAVFHAKPILGIPMFMDQHSNVAKAVAQGYALSVNFNTLNVMELKKKLKSLILNKKYQQTIAKYSKRFRDQPMTPLDTAVYWIEYVLRHEGALHMRNAGQDLNFWQYHSLDTIFTLFGGIALGVFLVSYFFVKVFCCVFCKKASEGKLKQK